MKFTMSQQQAQSLLKRLSLATAIAKESPATLIATQCVQFKIDQDGSTELWIKVSGAKRQLSMMVEGIKSGKAGSAMVPLKVFIDLLKSAEGEKAEISVSRSKTGKKAFIQMACGNFSTRIDTVEEPLYHHDELVECKFRATVMDTEISPWWDVYFMASTDESMQNLCGVTAVPDKKDNCLRLFTADGQRGGTATMIVESDCILQEEVWSVWAKDVAMFHQMLQIVQQQGSKEESVQCTLEVGSNGAIFEVPGIQLLAPISESPIPYEVIDQKCSVLAEMPVYASHQTAELLKALRLLSRLGSNAIVEVTWQHNGLNFSARSEYAEFNGIEVQSNKYLGCFSNAKRGETVTAIASLRFLTELVSYWSSNETESVWIGIKDDPKSATGKIIVFGNEQNPALSSILMPMVMPQKRAKAVKKDQDSSKESEQSSEEKENTKTSTENASSSDEKPKRKSRSTTTRAKAKNTEEAAQPSS